MGDRLFLRKIGDNYILHRVTNSMLTIEGDSHYTIGGIHPFYNLDLINCKEIELGIDLHKFSEQIYNMYDNNTMLYGGDHQMKLAYLAGVVDGLINCPITSETNEWDVEIVMDGKSPALDQRGKITLKRKN